MKQIHMSSARFVALGFVVIITAVSLSIAISYKQFISFADHVHKSLEITEKVELTTAMQDFARIRTISLIIMSTQNDIFKRDEEFQKMGDAASGFMLARSKLVLHDLDETEKKLLAEQSKSSTLVAPMQFTLAQFLISNPHAKDFENLFAKVIPMQTNTVVALNKLRKYEVGMMQNLTQKADVEMNQLLSNLILVGSIGLILYILSAIYITSHVSSVEVELNEQHDETKKLAATDDLTGLYNRRGFETMLNGVVSDARKRNNVLVALDLDNFKVINDTLGHSSGDEVLISISDIFREQVRESDIVGRVGGDEFSIVLCDCTIEQGLEISNKIIKAVKGFSKVRNTVEFTVGVSIGLTEMPNDLTEVKGMFKAVDNAMYKAKELGRNRTEIACNDY